jgi:hypothetical protein
MADLQTLRTGFPSELMVRHDMNIPSAFTHTRHLSETPKYALITLPNLIHRIQRINSGWLEQKQKKMRLMK